MTAANCRQLGGADKHGLPPSGVFGMSSRPAISTWHQLPPTLSPIGGKIIRRLSSHHWRLTFDSVARALFYIFVTFLASLAMMLASSSIRELYQSSPLRAAVVRFCFGMMISGGKLAGTGMRRGSALIRMAREHGSRARPSANELVGAILLRL